MRADAQRNRDRIVEVAREVFREQGYDASLDEVARRAGVGPGTLYRHFPKRENLIDAIMQSWVDRVNETADKALAHEGPPRDLLLGWFEAYVAQVILAGPPLCRLISATYASNQFRSTSRGWPSSASALSAASSTRSTQLCMIASMRFSRRGKCR